MLLTISATKMNQKKKVNSLKDLPRIEMLLAMVRWDSIPQPQDTRYMTIEPNEYKERPVLPTPLQIMNITDNRRFPTFSMSLSENAPKNQVEKPIIKTKNISGDSRSNNYPHNPGNGNSSNRAITRAAKPPKPKK